MRMSRYYDYVLWLIPVALIGPTVAFGLAGLSLTTALSVGAVAAAAVTAHAVFVRTPTGEDAPRSPPTDGEGASGRAAVGATD